MPRIYLYLLDTLADWEPGHVLAELHSGRYLKDPTQRYEIVPFGHTMDAITTMGGLKLRPEITVADLQPDRGDLILLPGGDTWLDPAQKPVIEKVRKILDGDAVVAAICGATLGLADAGLLDNRPHTSNDPEVLTMFCPGYRGKLFYRTEPAVTDGNLITASGLAPVEFACHVFRRLKVMSPETLTAWHALVTTRKPECYYALVESLRHGQPLA